MSFPYLKKTKPFGMPKTPFDPTTGEFESFSLEEDFGIVQQMVITDVNVSSSALISVYVKGNSESTYTVLKPYVLQRSPFDGKTVNGVSYVYSDYCTRVATKDDVSETQKITPDYIVGEELFAINSDDEEWHDLNVAGRCWAVSTEDS